MHPQRARREICCFHYITDISAFDFQEYAAVKRAKTHEMTLAVIEPHETTARYRNLSLPQLSLTLEWRRNLMALTTTQPFKPRNFELKNALDEIAKAAHCEDEQTPREVMLEKLRFIATASDDILWTESGGRWK